jgi:hypothetical protein
MGEFKLQPTPNPRSLLRLQAAAMTFESSLLPFKILRLGNEPTARLEDLFVVAYALRQRMTVLRARRHLQLPLRGPSRLAKRFCSPLERVLLALPVEVAVSELRNTAPNLELRALKAWAEPKGWTLPQAARKFAIAERTVRRWRAGNGRLHPMQTVAAAVDVGDLKAVLSEPLKFRFRG